ncbi:uncharacterized protein G2W53_009821 [Senna tora]|uniref:Uncharacterized protein n=1 Tax=Senna tora TaxID=362788 RepID=A0A835CDB4_9FABA|nr:uncharacterized protein G2W53_009821 [Senna tora]
MLRLESSWHGRSIDHVLTYSERQIAVGSQKPSRITRQKTRCASESNTSVRVVFANRSDKSRLDLRNLHELRGKRLVAQGSQTRRFANGCGFDAPIGVVLAWEERRSSLNIFRTTNRRRTSETFTNYEAKDSLRKLESSWHGRSVDHVLTYFRRQIAVGSQKPSRITRQKTRCASESNTSFALYSRTEVVLMLRLESSLHGRSVDHVSTYSGRQIMVGSQKPSRITRQKTCCASESNTSVRVVFANGSGFDAPIGVVLAWEERGSCLNIFRTTNRGRISETFTNYEAKDLLRKNLHELGGKRLVAQVSQTRRFANESSFDAPIGVVLAWEERGSCLNIFRMKNRSQISETFMNYEAKDLLRDVDLVLTYSGRKIAVGSQEPYRITRQKTRCSSESNTSSSWHGRSVDHVLTYFGRQIAVGSQKPSRITRQKTRCASESNTSVRVVFANRSGFDAPIGVVLAWEERGSCLNIFERQIAVGSQKPSRITRQKTCCVSESNMSKPSRITRQKTCCASESNTSVRVVFANRSGFDAPIGVVLAWKERGSCLNISRTTNRDDKSRSDLRNLHELRGKRLVAQVSRTRRFANQSGFDAPIGVVLAWEERGSCLNIFRTTNRNDKSRSDLRNLHELRGKRLVAQVSQTRWFANESGFDAPIGVVLAWEERGSCLNIFRTKNRDKSRSDLRNLHELRGKRLVAQVSQTHRFANRSGFDAPIGVVLAWEERRSCLNIFRTTNRDQISETFTNYEAKDLLRNRLGMGGAWIMSQHISDDKSRSDLRNLHELRGKRLVEQVSQTRRFANRSGFDAPIGVVLAWDERGLCLNIFRMTNRGRISETFMNYVAKDLLRKNLHELRGKRFVAQVSRTRRFANQSGFDAPIGVVLAREERRSCLSIFRTTNRAQISETFRNYEAKDLLCKNIHELRGKRLVAQVSQTRRFANQSGFDAPIGVVLAWEERGSCLNIFRTTNRGRISESFTNYEATELLRKNLHELRGKRLVAQVSRTRRFANQSSFDAPIGVVLAREERRSCVNIFRTTNRGQISETFTNYEAKDFLRNESNSSVRVVFANRSGFDAPIGVVLPWEERGSCFNIFSKTNRGRISETFTNYTAKDLLRKNLHELRGKRLVAQVSQTRQFANRSGFDAPIGVVLAWEDRRSCLNIFRTTNRSRISETFTKYDAKDLLCKQKTCCASESNMLVRVVFANRSGFDASIGVVLAWEERGSCLNIFRTTNRGRISETFTNYEAKDLCASESNTSVRVVFANRSGFDAPIGSSWHGKSVDHVLNIFRTTNRGRISETFTN